jgi:hypothetical protein
MRTDPIGIPGDLDHLEHQYQPPPQPLETKRERAVVWNRFDAGSIRDRPVTLHDLEEFLASARQDGAPDDALVFALPSLLRVGWYAS